VTPSVTIYSGDVYASATPILIRTLLGSCVAACLRDPASGVGGMNHFMLPDANGHGREHPERFGVHAMERLIAQIQKLGGARARLEAKVFGGGHVLQGPDSVEGVAQQNVRFIRAFLREEGLRLAAADLGGRLARQILFHTGTGRVQVRRLPGLRVPEPGPAAPAHGAVFLFTP